jgi:hypothetical protein
MLVSRAWAELAVEFMYESLVIGDFGVGRPEQVFATLEGSTGFVLKKWVKRIDYFRCRSAPEWVSVIARLAGIRLPNLRVQNTFLNREVEMVPVPMVPPQQPLHLVEACGSPILDRLEAFGSLRCLTLWIIGPLPSPFHLPSNLRRLNIIAYEYETEYLQVKNIFSTRDPLPNLTHLTLHEIFRAPDRFTWIMEIINHIGPRLRHLSLMLDDIAQDWSGADLRTILCACPQLTELVIPSPLATWVADPDDYGHLNLQTLGIPGSPELDFMSIFDIYARREAFPKLGTIRLVSWRGEKVVNPLSAPYALRLRDHGIQLENWSGHPFPLVSVLDDHT